MSQEQDIAAWANRQYSTPKTDYSPYVFGVVAVVVVLWLISRPRSVSTPTPAPIYHSLAERVAFEDTGRYDATTVAPLLKRLAAKFSTSEDEIANATYRAQELLKSKYAVTMSMEDIMAVADEAGNSKLTIREVLGTYLGLRETRNHDQAISTMHALWADLGL